MEGVRVPVSVTAGHAAGGGGAGAAAAHDVVVGDGGAGLLHRGFERAEVERHCHLEHALRVAAYFTARVVAVAGDRVVSLVF